MTTDTLVFYHAPQTRGTGLWFLLEELGIPYEMKVINQRNGDNRQPEFLAINPLGKFPTLVHNGNVITEKAIEDIHHQMSQYFLWVSIRLIYCPLGAPTNGDTNIPRIN